MYSARSLEIMEPRSLPPARPCPRLRGPRLHRLPGRRWRSPPWSMRCAGSGQRCSSASVSRSIVDGIDGTMARRVRVAELLPRWSGDVLDLVVDFITYVFVPAYAIAAGGLLPDLLALPAGIVDRDHRRALFRRPQDEDRGQLFPRVSRRCGTRRRSICSCSGRRHGWRRAIVVALAALTFVPFKFIHPMRVARLRALNICRPGRLGGAGAGRAPARP